MSYKITKGDVLAVARTIPDNTYNAILSDPPYGLAFMGKGWDHGVPAAEVWAELHRISKPGAFLFAFGGTRTFHRLAVAIEDAGWEIRDCIMWTYGSGFPKSHDISKGIDKAAGVETETRYKPQAKNAVFSNGKGKAAGVDRAPGAKFSDPPAAQTWEGYGTALKPAWEPVIVAMKPNAGTYADNSLAHGVAGLNIDGGRVGVSTSDRHEYGVSGDEGDPNVNTYGTYGRVAYQQHTAGRWPANLIHDGSPEVVSLFPETAVTGHRSQRSQAAQVAGTAWGTDNHRSTEYANETGSAARFFYCAKAQPDERNAGLGAHLTNTVDDGRQIPIDNAYQRGKTLRRNTHPTVKPLDLCRYLATLLLPPAAHRAEARILVPFSGSGSEMIGAVLAGWRNVDGIELDAEGGNYIEIAQARLAYWERHTLAGAFSPVPAIMADHTDLPLFQKLDPWTTYTYTCNDGITRTRCAAHIPAHGPYAPHKSKHHTVPTTKTCIACTLTAQPQPAQPDEDEE